MKRLSMVAAVVLVVLMVHAWGVSAVNVSPRVSCEPNCTGLDEGKKVANPRDCSEFYFCSGNTPLGPFSCEDGNNFYVGGESCEEATDEEDKTCGACASSLKKCQLTCYEPLTIIADAHNCNVYYICTAGEPVPLECPKDRPHFDKDNESCVNDKSVCCTGYCEAYCDRTGFSLVPDPNDCTGYFICEGVGPPEENYHLQCDGGYFSVQLGACVSGTPPDPCPTLCGATGEVSSTTTTTTQSSTTTTTTTTPSSSTTTTTTTTPSSTTTTTTTTPGGGVTDINGCVSSLVCTDEGYFPACSTCQRDYFSCSGAGAQGVKSSCPGDTVFNPTSGYGYCMLLSNCLNQ